MKLASRLVLTTALVGVAALAGIVERPARVGVGEVNAVRIAPVAQVGEEASRSDG
jgi:hypothetical protein